MGVADHKTTLGLDKMVVEFTQEENCIDDNQGGVESITIECVADLGISTAGGNFFVIRTEQWAINDVSELKALFDKIEKAIKILK